MSNISFENKKLTEELKKSGASVTKKDDQIYKSFLNPKVTPDKQFYRLRLLYFSDVTSKRNFPFIEKYCHTVYKRDDAGKLSIEYVTCPTSPYLNIDNAWMKCPCCQYANAQYELAKSTEWKNKTATNAHRKMRRQFVSFLPVYVVSDPNVAANSGRVMILNIRDIEAHKKLTEIIKVTEYNNNVFNGKSAVDLALAVVEKQQKDKDGNIRINKTTGEAYTYREFKFQFSSKPYDIDIPIDQIETLGFDDSMWTYSSEEELRSFLQKHVVVADVPDDDIAIDLGDSDKKNEVRKPASTSRESDDIDFGADTIDIGSPTDKDEISDDIEFDMGGSSEPSNSTKSSVISDEIDINSVLEEFDNIDLDDISY